MNSDQHNQPGFDLSDQVILIIDDDPNSLGIVSGYLEERRCTVLIAEDGESGLQRADYARPDLILLDIMMPGMDGYETCRRLKERESTKDIPVIFMTALAETGHKIRGFAAGAVDYVTKPIQQEEVAARVGVHLRLRQLTIGLRNANESLEKRVEERTTEVKNSERRLADIIDHLPDAAFAVNRAGEITLWNRTAEELTGLKAESMLGKGDHAYAIPFHGERRPLLLDLVFEPSSETEAQYQNFKKIDTTLVGESYCSLQGRANKAYMLLTAAPLHDSSGTITEAIEFLRDLTERKQAEEEIQRLNERFNLAISAARLGVWDWDIPNNTLAWDDRMFALYGRQREDFTGAYEAWLQGVHPEDRAACDEISRLARLGEREYDTEFRVVWPDGSIHHLKAYGQVVRDAEGTPLRMTGINYDITELKRAEAEIRSLNAELEQRVVARTAELKQKNQELERLNKVFVGRELRMIELKQQIQELEKQQGKPG